jgi:exopolysaccharide biosynthesis polyprenyl glycosylphosphotransferase
MDIGFFQGNLPVLTFHTKSLDAQQLFLKRCMDIMGAACGLLVLVLLFPLAALAIKRDSPGPIFFGQERVGQSGRTFKCWKFRSMYIDAEARKQELMAQNEMNGAIFKIKNDPRITKVGRFLRKTSLDEFPQFWNVLRGDKSLVGTRPPTPDEVAKYEIWHRRRLSIKPGITGMWQTSGRNRIEDFDEIVRLDLYYIDKWTIWLDILILLKTVRAVLVGSGRY